MSRRPLFPTVTRALVLAALLALAAPLCPALAGAPVLPCRIKAEFPHDTRSFTEGLCIENGRMYESSGGWGVSYLAEADRATGKRLHSRDVDPKRFAEGLAAANGGLYLLTWRSGQGSIHSLDDLSPLGTFDYRVPTDHSEGWGLTFDGSRFIISSGTDALTFHQPEDFSPMGEVRVHDGGKPVLQLNELEYAEELILANIWKQDRIAVIDPADGAVTAWIDLSPLRRLVSPGAGVANGIAYDRETGRLFVTGKHWDKLFEIEPDFNAWQRRAGDRE